MESAAPAAPAAATQTAAAIQEQRKRTFKKFEYRGVDLDHLLDLTEAQVYALLPARARRCRNRGLKTKHLILTKKILNAKKGVAPGEKPAAVNTHCRDKIILPNMIGSVVGVYNGRVFNAVEIKPEMVGHYLGEFSLTYKPVHHGRPGIGATHSSRFVPLK